MTEAAPIVRIVDDDRSFIDALGRLLSAAGFAVLPFTSADQLLADRSEEPGCIIADLRMPGMDGFELQERVARGSNALPVIFLTGDGDIPATVRAMRHGAEDFLTKSAPKEQLFEAIGRALARDRRQREARKALRAIQERLATLTPREMDVLQHVVEGRLNKQIAAELGISERTVKMHRTSITSKLHVRSVAKLTRLAQTAGLLDPLPRPLPKGQ